MTTAVLWVVAVLATIVADLRWIRVTQREHYYPGRVLAIARLWLAARPENVALLLVGAVLVVVGLGAPVAAIVGMVLLAFWPWGLSVRATLTAMAWTQRVIRLTVVLVVLQAAALALTGPVGAQPIVVLLAPAFVAVAAGLMWPIEKRANQRFVVRAQTRIRQVAPRIVGITGSYGKTSTKLYVAQLLAGQCAVVASPASFNNLMGLSRTVNDRVQPGTDVFVAEMGTYGPGEIRELCASFPPDVAVITTIGEAHLERMGSRAVIVAAKSEITEHARAAVLNVDVPELAALADRLAAGALVVRTASTPGADADVVVTQADGRWSITLRDGAHWDAAASPGGHASNLASAIGVVLALGLDPGRAVPGVLGSLPVASHRAEAQTTADGVVVVDDTYNSNPVGAATALRSTVALVGADAHVFVVTPGMVELGSAQHEANMAWATACTAQERFSLAVVGATNRRALLAGATGPGQVSVFANRAAAVAAVMAQARSGDAVLFENDLPDHYP